MEDWISALKSVQKWETYEVSFSSLPQSASFYDPTSLFILLADTRTDPEMGQIDDPLIKASRERVI